MCPRPFSGLQAIGTDCTPTEKPDGKERTARDSMLSEPDPAYPESLNTINLDSKRTTARPVTISYAPIPRVAHSLCVNRSVTFLLAYLRACTMRMTRPSTHRGINGNGDHHNHRHTNDRSGNGDSGTPWSGFGFGKLFLCVVSVCVFPYFASHTKNVSAAITCLHVASRVVGFAIPRFEGWREWGISDVRTLSRFQRQRWSTRALLRVSRDAH